MRELLKNGWYAAVRRMAGSDAATRVAIALRDRANQVVQFRFEDSPWVEISGERLVIELLGPSVCAFVDVGGNHGEWTGRLLDTAPPAGCAQRRGLVFDASNSAIGLLRERFQNVAGLEIVHAAVADRTGTVTFHEEPAAGGTSSCVATQAQPGATMRTVDCVQLDDELARRDLGDVDFLKIDVEGFDGLVLRGARQSVRARRFGVIQWEYTRAWARAGTTLTGVLDELREAGYATWALKGDGLYDVNRLTYGEHWGASNWIAARPDWAERLRPLLRGVL